MTVPDLPDFDKFTAPEAYMTDRRQRVFTIGLPCCETDAERRFPITPEGVEMLVERGFSIKMETGAAASIHYSDEAYARRGATVTTREETLLCDIVIHLAPMPRTDIRRMRRGAMLLTMLNITGQKRETVKELLDRGIISIAIDLITDRRGNLPFADILSEVDGRAAMAIASSLLADSCHGKGILLGGVAGIIPCEVMIVGSGIAARAAARSATGLGATVRMFDNDVYSLREAVRELGPQIIGSSFHDSVVTKALASADVIVITDAAGSISFPIDLVDTLKKGVVTIDASSHCGCAFPSMPTVDLGTGIAADSRAERHRVCYVHAGSAVPRTAAMALTNTFITLLDEILTTEGVTNALRLSPGLQAAAFTFLGKVTNATVAKVTGQRHVDINLFLHLS